MDFWKERPELSDSGAWVRRVDLLELPRVPVGIPVPLGTSCDIGHVFASFVCAGLTDDERAPTMENMSTNPLIDEILRLPADQRLNLLEDIWTSPVQSPEDVPVPDWHRDLLDERQSDPDEQPTRTWEEVQANAGRLRE